MFNVVVVSLRIAKQIWLPLLMLSLAQGAFSNSLDANTIESRFAKINDKLQHKTIFTTVGRKMISLKACESCQERRYKFHRWASKTIGKPVFCASKTELLVKENSNRYLWIKIPEGIGKGVWQVSDPYSVLVDKSTASQTAVNILDADTAQTYSEILHKEYRKIRAENLASGPGLLMDMFF